MTKEELIQKLNLIQSDGIDEEIAHSKADELLLEYINDKRVTEAFEKIQKWYA